MRGTKVKFLRKIFYKAYRLRGIAKDYKSLWRKFKRKYKEIVRGGFDAY